MTSRRVRRFFTKEKSDKAKTLRIDFNKNVLHEVNEIYLTDESPKINSPTSLYEKITSMDMFQKISIHHIEDDANPDSVSNSQQIFSNGRGIMKQDASSEMLEDIKKDKDSTSMKQDGESKPKREHARQDHARSKEHKMEENQKHSSADKVVTAAVNSSEPVFDSSSVPNIPNEQELSLINYILKVLNEFDSNLKSKAEYERKESLDVEGDTCYAYHYVIYADEMKNYVQSTNFVFNRYIFGKSNSLIFFTADFRYAIKVLDKSQFKFAESNAVLFDSYVNIHKESRIAKIAGIYSSPKCNFVIMRNIFDNPYTEVYDLKGKGMEREERGLKIESNWMGNKLKVTEKEELLKTLKKDLEFLISLKAIDYSLVIGIKPSNETGFCVLGKEGFCRTTFHTKGNEEFSLGFVDFLTPFSLKHTYEHLKFVFCCVGTSVPSCSHDYAKRLYSFIDRNVFE